MPPFVDGHLDLAYLAERGVDLRSPSPDPHRACVNLPALAAAGVRLAFGTIFTESIDEASAAGPDDGRMAGMDEPRVPESWEYRGPADLDGARRAGERQLRIYQDLERDGSIRIVRRRGDLQPLDDGGPLRVVILMEGADPIASAAELPRWFDAGVRLVALAWAKGSRYSGGNARPGPLTDAGRELLQAMESLGVILDASHLPDLAFDEALERFSGRVVASHSNCRALLEPSQRHLRDDQVRRIAERDGVIGLNLYGAFLANGREATIDDAVHHVLRLRHLAGAGRVGLGSDLDGGFPPTACPEGLRRPEDLPALSAALTRSGVTTEELRLFEHGAWLRFLSSSLPG